MDHLFLYNKGSLSFPQKMIGGLMASPQVTQGLPTAYFIVSHGFFRVTRELLSSTQHLKTVQ